jgi:hypothetical protein
VADERQSTHWQECWRAVGHHACAIHLLDLILREHTIGEDEARRQLAEAKIAADQWADDCEDFGCTEPAHSSRSIASSEAQS